MSPGLFDTLEPPRGGLAGLRARIERESGRRKRVRRLWAAAACLPVILAAVLLLSNVRRQPPMPERFRLARIAAGLEAPPSEPMTIAENRRHLVAAQRMPAASDNVAFYLVASID
jgi:hypothetical protein